MNKTKSMLTVLAAVAFMMCSAFIVQGQNARTWVSGLGNDANAPGCQQATPCRLLQTAFNNTNPGGQVVALDSAGYGPITINKSITIEGSPGVQAFIFVAPSTTGITVSGGAATDTVLLRNIFVDGSGAPSTTGLSHTSAARLEVENCTFRSLTTGVSVTNAKMDLRNSTITGNTTGATVSGTGTDGGAASVATALLTIDGGSISFNGTGLFMTNPGANPIFNIHVHSTGSGWFTNFMGNTTAVSGTGTGCPCTFVQTYTNQTNPH
jgi:hypothetical protein